MLEIMGGKRLVINMIANIVAFVVQFGINFVLTPHIVRTLGSEGYGFVQLSNHIEEISSRIRQLVGSVGSLECLGVSD